MRLITGVDHALQVLHTPSAWAQRQRWMAGGDHEPFLRSRRDCIAYALLSLEVRSRWDKCLKTFKAHNYRRGLRKLMLLAYQQGDYKMVLQAREAYDSIEPVKELRGIFTVRTT